VADKLKSIDEYIANAPSEHRRGLEEIRVILAGVAPDATEAIKWGAPVFEHDRILFSFKGSKKHLTFMPTRTALEAFREELEGYETGTDTVMIPWDQPLPKDLIRRMAEFRVDEVAGGGLWKHRS
jgi:uncharacterized protein YdhG (YjbR/CyaY superfamily)